MALDSGDSRQLAQAQTWTLLASQIIPPRKHSPCPRARMQDPTGPGPGIRTGSGRTPGRTAAAAHHPRHRTGTTLGDFTRKLQTQRTDLATRTQTRPANLYPGAARLRTRDWAAPLDVPAAPGMERPSQPTLTHQPHGPALRHPNLAGSSTVPTTRRQSHGPRSGPSWRLSPSVSRAGSSLPDPGRMLYGLDILPGKTKWDPSSTTRMAWDSGSGQLAQVQTWDSLGKSNHSTKETLSLPTCKDAGPYWARTRD